MRFNASILTEKGVIINSLNNCSLDDVYNKKYIIKKSRTTLSTATRVKYINDQNIVETNFFLSRS